MPKQFLSAVAVRKNGAYSSARLKANRLAGPDAIGQGLTTMLTLPAQVDSSGDVRVTGGASHGRHPSFLVKVYDTEAVDNTTALTEVVPRPQTAFVSEGTAVVHVIAVDEAARTVTAVVEDGAEAIEAEFLWSDLDTGSHDKLRVGAPMRLLYGTERSTPPFKLVAVDDMYVSAETDIDDDPDIDDGAMMRAVRNWGAPDGG